uniref:Uncharacterized protein n=1 Tax=Bactrocera latifrons TaxID=174628 RepID=A0A0K8VKP2_BACLA
MVTRVLFFTQYRKFNRNLKKLISSNSFENLNLYCIKPLIINNKIIKDSYRNMSCLCQYFVTSKNRKFIGHSTDGSDLSVFTQNPLALTKEESKRDEVTKLNEEVSATELAAAKAEIWVLKKHLSEAQISVENLENLVRTIILKQNELLGEMYELKNQNYELQEECRMQRDYQMMERNAMMREMHEIKTLLGDRTRLLVRYTFPKYISNKTILSSY